MSSQDPQEDAGSVGWTVALIAEDVARWVMLRLALTVAGVGALMGLVGEGAPPALRVGTVVSGGLALGVATAVAVRQEPITRGRAWTIILVVLLVCGGLTVALLLSDDAGR
ncbi:hypothetical protein [Nocardioides solisilvae]|uniref:hypothetical protein n=1 Tax=Nocardioides solisilvae TaxID=1542435 RepID=UPI000D740AC1|nr:hypothetical protein [Nocardioides solisilvae]